MQEKSGGDIIYFYFQTLAASIQHMANVFCRQISRRNRSPNPHTENTIRSDKNGMIRRCQSRNIALCIR
jgi:hypothetical protein